MAVKEVMDAIQSTLQSTGLVATDFVSFYSGKPTFEELKLVSLDYPSLFISCLNFQDESDESNKAALSNYELVLDANFIVSVVVKNTENAEIRNTMARLLAEGVMLNLIDQDWGLKNCLIAENRSVEGLFVNAAEQGNCSIWLVSWSQSIGLDKDAAQSDINDWLRYHADHYNQDNSDHIMASSDVDIAS